MKVVIYDIETMREFFLAIFYDPESDSFREFHVNKNRCDLYQLVDYLTNPPFDYAVGYNNVSFDGQVLEYIIRNHQTWMEKANLEISSAISRFAQECIEKSNYNLFPTFREEYFTVRNIDLFKIHHFDNENRRTSLKWLEFMMDMDNVEEMPVAWDKTGLTDEEIETTVDYCKNDILATYKFYLYTIGQTEDELYKGRNKIQDRFDVIDEYSFPNYALNWSDVKIGDQINLVGYQKYTGLSNNDVYKKKLNRGATKKFKFKDCIPDYVTFETPEFREFAKKVGEERVRLTGDKQKFSLTYNGTTYSIMKGGIHSTEKNRIIIPKDNEILRDADVGSQYPNAIRKRKLFPSHLGKFWLINYEATIQKRIDYKDKGSISARYKGVSEMLKLALNGGGFGKTNEPNNWQYDPLVTYYCTIGNQFEILMLIERLELAGIHCVSANTDGIVCLFEARLEDKYKEICEWWEVTVGNNILGKLEYTDFSALYQTSVNDYIAIKKKDGSVKKKGDFMTEFELNKNKSRRIIPLALEAYFKDGKDPEEFVRNHKNIFDFCIGVKSSKNYHYELIDQKTYEKDIYSGKILRYIVSTNGRTLIKVKNDGVEAKGNDVTHCEAPDKDDDRTWKCTVVNRIDRSKDISEYNIDYEYYLRKIYRIINNLQKDKSKKLNKSNQISMF